MDLGSKQWRPGGEEGPHPSTHQPPCGLQECQVLLQTGLGPAPPAPGSSEAPASLRDSLPQRAGRRVWESLGMQHFRGASMETEASGVLAALHLLEKSLTLPEP